MLIVNSNQHKKVYFFLGLKANYLRKSEYFCILMSVYETFGEKDF